MKENSLPIQLEGHGVLLIKVLTEFSTSNSNAIEFRISDSTVVTCPSSTQKPLSFLIQLTPSSNSSFARSARGPQTSSPKAHGP